MQNLFIQVIMGKHSSETLVSFSIILEALLIFPLFLTQYYATATEMYTSCVPFSCGNFINITYPFWNFNYQPQYCGHPKFKVDCQNGHLTIDIKSTKFSILHLNQTTKFLRIGRVDLYNLDANHLTYCPKNDTNVNMDLDFFKYTPNNENYTALFKCHSIPDNLLAEVSDSFLCKIRNRRYSVYVVPNTKLADFTVMKCKNRIMTPGISSSIHNSEREKSSLYKGFEIEWIDVGDDKCHACMKSGGTCMFKNSENTVTCLLKKSLQKGTGNLSEKLFVGAIFVVLATIVVILAIYIYWSLQIEESQATEITHNFRVHHIFYFRR